MLSSSSNNKVVRFYRNNLRVSDLQYTFEDWLTTATDDEWETCHNFIQWLFPSMHVSSNAPQAFLTDDTVFVFQTEYFQMQMRRAFWKYMQFLGFNNAMHAAGPVWVLEDRGKIRTGQHNCARISRVLRSTRLAGLLVESCGLLRTLLEHVRARTIVIADPSVVQRWIGACLDMWGTAQWADRPHRDCVRECTDLIAAEQRSALAPVRQLPRKRDVIAVSDDDDDVNERKQRGDAQGKLKRVLLPQQWT
jgi:hypothetical protein